MAFSAASSSDMSSSSSSSCWAEAGGGGGGALRYASRAMCSEYVLDRTLMYARIGRTSRNMVLAEGGCGLSMYNRSWTDAR